MPRLHGEGMHTRQDRGPRARRSEQGFTLIELMVSFGVLMVVLLGFSRLLIASQMASNTTHEATLAKEAARSMLEVIQASPRFGETYATYNSDTADDPDPDAPGAGFDVRGLEAPPGDADGRPGQIIFPEQGGELSENVNLPQFGWVDLDLNGDGDHDDANVSDDYKFLPVLVRVEWSGAGGPGLVEFRTLVANY